MADIQFQVLYFLPKYSRSGRHLTLHEMRLSANVGDGRSAVWRLTGAADHAMCGLGTRERDIRR